MLNKEMLAEEFSYAGPFYHHHLTEELRQTDYQRDKQKRYSLCLPSSHFGDVSFGYYDIPYQYRYHRSNMELDLHSLLRFLCTDVSLAETRNSSPPRI
jgi:hypothetical protein